MARLNQDVQGVIRANPEAIRAWVSLSHCTRAKQGPGRTLLAQSRIKCGSSEWDMRNHVRGADPLISVSFSLAIRYAVVSLDAWPCCVMDNQIDRLIDLLGSQ